jgi:hypothetical protein
MALADKFRRTVHLMVDRRLSSADAHQRVGAFARARVAELISNGTGSPVFRRFVDNVEGAPEEAVRLDGGQIVYVWSKIALAAAYALSLAVERSPVHSGDYKRAWFLVVDNVPWTDDIARIPAGSVVILTNKEPYHRKIDTGGQRTSVPPLITEDVRQAVQRRFPALRVQRLFVNLPGGANYRLRGQGRESGLSYNKKTATWTRKHAPRPSRRSDRQAGALLSYPAVQMVEAV